MLTLIGTTFRTADSSTTRRSPSTDHTGPAGSRVISPLIPSHRSASPTGSASHCNITDSPSQQFPYPVHHQSLHVTGQYTTDQGHHSIPGHHVTAWTVIRGGRHSELSPRGTGDRDHQCYQLWWTNCSQDNIPYSYQR